MISRNIRSCLREGPPSRKTCSTLSSDHQHGTLISLLRSCNQTIQTAQIHGLMLKTGLDAIPFPLSKLLARICLQDINYASALFRKIKCPNPYMFNSMLRGYSVSDDPQKGLLLFNWMRNQDHDNDFLLDRFTFVSVLKSCSRLLDVRAGLTVHKTVLATGFDLFLNVKNALMHFYSVCGRTRDAHQVFDEMGEGRDLVSWNTLMGAYLCMAEYHLVLDLFKDLCRDKVGLSVAAMANVLSALGEIRNLYFALCVHGLCIKIGFLSKLNVATVLISMYGKQNRIHSARRIFDEIDFEKDVVLWNCLIDAYSKSGLLGEALELLTLMKDDNVQPNSSTLAGLLSVPSGALTKYVLKYVAEQEMELDVVLGTALVDTYAKRGLIGKAVDVFNRMESKDVRCWTAMISGYGVHGEASRAVKLFGRMEEEGFTPNEVTFLAVLNSCSHGGLVEEGMRYFRRMVEVYELVPKIEHYGCVVDLLGRAGLLEEAYQLIKGLPVEKDATAWRALLGACRVYGCVDLAKRVKQELEVFLGEHPADLLALTGTYVVAGMAPHHRFQLENKNCYTKELQNEKVPQKEAGYSTIELV